MNDAIVIYDTITGEIKAEKLGEYWVLPASQSVFSGTIEEVEQHTTYTDDGDALFLIEDSNAS